MTAFLIAHMALMTASLQGEFIFPPNALHNHSSSIVETPQGDLLAVWFHGTGERWADDVLVQGARKRAGEAAWSEPFIMADTPDLPDCNPALFMDPRGVLWLLWIVVQDNQWGGSLLKYRTSDDYTQDGPPRWNWQDAIHVRPKELEERFVSVIDEGMQTYGTLLESFIPNLQEVAHDARTRAGDKLHQRLGWMPRTQPIMLNDTTMMLGLYSDVFNCSLAAFTSDWGATWTFSTPILDPEITMLGNIQPAFALRKNGDIVAYMRDNGLPKQVRQSVSTDGGMTWAPITLTGISNPGSSVNVCVLHSGNWVMICNDTMLGRHKLTAYLSDDEGETWKWSRRLEETEFEGGSFSYPTVMQAKDETVHVTYSHKRKDVEGSTIKHVWFNESWIRDTAGE